MAFHKIDMDNWERREHYYYYRDFIKTRYNLCGEIDITGLLSQIREKRLHFYLVFLYVVIHTVNEIKELRMCLDQDGALGYWDVCHPSYTIFHKDDLTFSDIWTEYSPDFQTFYERASQDMETFKDVKGIKAKPDTPPNFCPISCIPWISFTGFGSDTYAESNMLYPVILFGKYHENEKGQILLPLSIAVNHMVADGYHTCLFFQKIQEFSSSLKL
ncbi:MAG TPA: chloramphenicol acetyltransferase [Candidatus Lachnoclostridium stercoravium]|uniref:Chloramphenicol acetyltransferase n=1 Tax=Candidatus Lachnoclostridium stercoravium TaxID=2838633 RepID=A0A9D2HJL3_9FIRM|nr:chloramphenicol acetyltransferase [Candidatus Lachnoclostridium stercoravium]